MKSKKHLDKCSEKDCKYNMSGICCYGLRNKFGCYLDSELLHNIKQQEIQIENRYYIAQKYNAMLKKKHISEMTKYLANKQYEFICCNHHFTIKDSARNQGECPHCGKKHIDGFYTYKDDEFIGYKEIDKNQTVLCFECKKCFNKFFYHIDTNGDTYKLMKNFLRKI